MHAKYRLVLYRPVDIRQRDAVGRLCERKAAGASRRGGHELCLFQIGHQAPDHHGIGIDAKRDQIGAYGPTSGVLGKHAHGMDCNDESAARQHFLLHTIGRVDGLAGQAGKG